MRLNPPALILATCLVAGSTAGCGGSQSTPAGAARTFASHVEARRYGEAYELLSEETKKILSRQDFERLLAEHPELSAEIKQALIGSPGAQEPVVTATLTTKSGRVLKMVFEKGEFRFDESAVELYPRRTPQETVESFVSALRRQRYDVLLEFIPKDQIEGIDATVLKTSFEGPQKSEIAHLLAALDGAISASRVEVLGERAVVSYGTQSSVELILEDGLWKIEEFK